MPERLSPGADGTETGQARISLEELAKIEYSKGSSGLAKRWTVYDYAQKRLNYYDVAYQNLDLEDEDTLLDVGSHDGAGLISLRALHRNRCRMIGVDIDTQIFQNGLGPYINERFKQYGLRPIDYVAAQAEYLPFHDDTIDGTLAIFMVYHSPEPIKVLHEIKRVTKPNGKIVIATSGPRNKILQRQFEVMMAGALRKYPPPLFTEKFNSNQADVVLPEMFTVVKEIHQQKPLIIKPPEEDDGASYKAYYESMASMRKHYGPIEPSPAMWQTAFNRTIKPIIDHAFKKYGVFKDTVDRTLYVCRNDK